jgi:hypothetical protein
VVKIFVLTKRRRVPDRVQTSGPFQLSISCQECVFYCDASGCWQVQAASSSKVWTRKSNREVASSLSKARVHTSSNMHKHRPLSVTFMHYSTGDKSPAGRHLRTPSIMEISWLQSNSVSVFPSSCIIHAAATRLAITLSKHRRLAL